ncbi:MAG: hypothetical protein AMK70_16445 [Nitrospira bacterium SG8_35_1]|nr:MAG: hypothetical protein AMK70_16445 [Nitrospira bacterium SG8_35_1]
MNFNVRVRYTRLAVFCQAKNDKKHSSLQLARSCIFYLSPGPVNSCRHALCGVIKKEPQAKCSSL